MKLSIIGAGNVGATTAFIAALKSSELGIDEIVLVDIVEKIPQGKALDLNQCVTVFNLDVKIVGSNSYADTENSDVVVITAGLPRKPGMSRDDLIDKNAGIVKGVVENIMKFSDHPWIIIVTNPLDAMVYVASSCVLEKRGKDAADKVIGMAGTLDSARMRFFLAEELGEGKEAIEALTIGSHGDEMVPLMSSATANQKSLSKVMNDKKMKEIVDRTKKGGAEIVDLLGTSAYYAPAAAIVEIIEAIDTEKIVPVSVNYRGVFIGVPVKLSDGTVEIQQNMLDSMNSEEKKMFDDCIEKVKSLIDKTEEILKNK
ncbi:MAG: malate dehydrogenase [Nanoarchaeota archaeon]|nr:malate dehydrogenase [Nanoarchaeota archaeon]